MRKRKLHKNRTLSFKGIIIIFVFISLFFSVGYSFLVQDLTIGGTVSLKDSTINDSITSDDLKFNYTKGGWYSNGYYYYQLDMKLENISVNDIKDWKVTISLPEDSEFIGGWDSNMEIKDGKLIISGGLIEIGETLTFGVQFNTLTENIVIEEIILNGTKIIIDDVGGSSGENVIVNTKVANNWQSGDYYYQYDLTITNNNDYDINSWQFKVVLPPNATMDSVWGANYINANGIVTLSNLDYNGTIKIGETLTIGGIFKSPTAGISLQVTDIITD